MSETISRDGSARTRHRAVSRRDAQRVLDEVRADLEHAVVVGLDPRLLAFRDEHDAVLVRRGLVARRDLARNRREIDRLATHLERVPVHPRQVEQVADEPLEPLRLDQDRVRGDLGRKRSLARPSA